MEKTESLMPPPWKEHSLINHKLEVDMECPEALRPWQPDTASSGLDLRSSIDFTLEPGKRSLIPVGVKTRFIPGYEVQIRPRSGLALKHGITVLNTPGTIDSGYCNEWGVILFNTSDEPFKIKKGERIAQAVFCPICFPQITYVEKIEATTERGLKGFGSSGIS